MTKCMKHWLSHSSNFKDVTSDSERVDRREKHPNVPHARRDQAIWYIIYMNFVPLSNRDWIYSSVEEKKKKCYYCHQWSSRSVCELNSVFRVYLSLIFSVLKRCVVHRKMEKRDCYSIQRQKERDRKSTQRKTTSISDALLSKSFWGNNG